MTAQEILYRIRSRCGETQTARLDDSEIVDAINLRQEDLAEACPPHLLDLLVKQVKTDLVADQRYYWQKSANFPDLLKPASLLIHDQNQPTDSMSYTPADYIPEAQATQSDTLERYGDIRHPIYWLAVPADKTHTAAAPYVSLFIWPIPWWATTNGRGLIFKWVAHPTRFSVADLTGVPQIPVKMHSFIVTGGAATILKKLGDPTWVGLEREYMDQKTEFLKHHPAPGRVAFIRRSPWYRGMT